MNNQLADVSVVIPCFRCADTIERAIESVFHQTLRPSEVILVDDCSGDDTLDKLFAIKSKYPVEWINIIPLKINGGPGTARNTGWNASKQKYVAFLDSDDSWDQRKIEFQYGWMLSHPEVALTGHKCSFIDNIPHHKTTIEKLDFSIVSKNKLLLSNYFSTQTIMLKRDIPIRFQSGKKHSEDYLLACKICFKGYKCFWSSWPLSYLYKESYGAGGLSGDLWKMEKGELDTYYSLYKDSHIGLFRFLLTCSFSLIKYFRRLLLVKLRGINVFHGN